MNRRRLDVELVERGLCPSRARARDLILRGLVRVEGAVAAKAGAGVQPSDAIAIAAGAGDFVSRGADKLLAAIDHFGFAVAGVTAVDIGASTGGFTQVLLSRGADKVFAVDVGRDQLHVRLRADPRVIALEATDSRLLDRGNVPDAIGAVVADVSFISLTKALPAALSLATEGAWLIALIKPQFEAGRAAIGKGGIVRDAVDRERAVANVRAWLTDEAGWPVTGVMPSPITGGDGNQEFLVGAIKRTIKP